MSSRCPFVASAECDVQTTGNRSRAGGMMTPNDYRDQAGKCLWLVGQVGDEAARLALIEMAQIWLRLAAQCEKDWRRSVVPNRKRDALCPNRGLFLH